MRKDINQLAQIVSAKKRYLSELATPHLSYISEQCLCLLDDTEQLDVFLQQAIIDTPYCNLMYVTDVNFKQLSGNAIRQSIEPQYRGQDLSQRPYMKATIPLKGLVISNTYQNVHTSKPCISIIHAIQQDNVLLALLIADFDLEELPLPNDITLLMSNWHQFKGDPSIRHSLFSQQRSHSLLDINIDRIHALMQSLLNHNGVFHFKLHYSSSRATLWLYDQPHHYQLHNIDQLLNDELNDVYPACAYPAEAQVNEQQITIALEQFKALRFADENIYLRSASINIINGMVGLNFSCDGSHYIPINEFIDNSMEYWLGSLQTA